MRKKKENAIRPIFQQAGCSVINSENNVADDGFDLIIEVTGERYAATIKTLTTPRTDDVIGRFSTLILESRYAKYPPDTKPLLVVAVSRWGQPMIDRVRAHMEKHAPGVGWALIDDIRGAIHLERKADDGSLQPMVWYSDKPLISTTSYKAKLFTDLNSWLLKVLIYKDAPEPYRVDTPDRIINPNHLASLAEVSPRTAYSFFNAFSDMDFVRSTKNKGVHLVRLSSLLEMWIEEAGRVSPVRSHACSIFGELDDWKNLTHQADNLQFAIGGFGACRIHDVLHTNAKLVWDVHIDGDISNFERIWNLQSCGEGEAQINFIESNTSGSVFRGTRRKDSLPVVDIIQSALDVAPLPGRGLEQAQHIVNLIAQWGPQ